jgi:hypothetical protein
MRHGLHDGVAGAQLRFLQGKGEPWLAKALGTASPPWP